MKKVTFWIIFATLLGCKENHNDKLSEDKKTKESSIENYSQKDISGLYNSWMFKNFNLDDTIILLRLDSINHKGGKVITFNKNKSLNYWLYLPIPSCGNGSFYLDDSISNWDFNKKKDRIILDLQGGYNLEYDFKRKIEYIVDSSRVNKLILIKSKVYYNKKRPFGDLKFQ